MIIKAQRGRGRKVHLLLDDTYTITTDIDFWSGHCVPDGTELTEEEWTSLCEQIHYRKALQKATDFLSRRDHSRMELLQKLTRTLERSAAEKAVERLDELGYLDDERYARSLAAHLLGNKKFALSRAKQELVRRGVDRAVIELVMQENIPDPVTQIISLLQSKYARRLADEKGRRQVVSALQRLGYAYSDIRSAFYRYQTEFDEYEE